MFTPQLWRSVKQFYHQFMSSHELFRQDFIIERIALNAAPEITDELHGSFLSNPEISKRFL
jgi:hypothetical protein